MTAIASILDTAHRDGERGTRLGNQVNAPRHGIFSAHSARG
jgi:hypothetical protein